MHAVVLAWDGPNVEVAQSVNLQLEGQSWLKMAVDGVLLKLQGGREGGREGVPDRSATLHRL